MKSLVKIISNNTILRQNIIRVDVILFYPQIIEDNTAAIISHHTGQAL